MGDLNRPNEDDLAFDAWLRDKLRGYNANNTEMVGIINQKAYHSMEQSIITVAKIVQSSVGKMEYTDEESGVRFKLMKPKRASGSYVFLIWIPNYGAEFTDAEFKKIAASLPENTSVTILPASVTDEVRIEICYRNIITPIT